MRNRFVNVMADMMAPRELVIYGLLGLFAYVWVITAWISDDAYISFRVIQNFTHGNGLVFNLGERVQAYTHPLWLFCLSFVHFIVAKIFVPLNLNFFLQFGGLYTTSLILSFVFSLVAVWIFAFRVSVELLNAMLGILALLLSKAFIDFTSSGLENPLTYLLLALFALVYFREGMKEERKMLLLSLIAALGVLNRMDTALLFTPAVLYSIWVAIDRPRVFWASVAGGLVFILWGIFSLFYYGFFFPNTGYAKLNTGIPGISLALQGTTYFVDSIRFDPITLALIFSGIALPWIVKRRRLAAFSIGLVLYLLYILKIGGGFMAGRFFAAPYLVAVMILTRFSLAKSRFGLAAGLAVIVIGLTGRFLPIFTRTPYLREVMIDETGITDERDHYYPELGLLKLSENNLPPAVRWDWEDWHPDGKFEVVQYNSLGVFGYQVGPDVHLFDRNALVEPLLARLPTNPSEKWRIGHIKRDYPDGFIESLQAKSNRIENDALSEYYEKLKVLVSGDLRDKTRLVEIWKFNTGQYDHLLDKYIAEND